MARKTKAAQSLAEDIVETASLEDSVSIVIDAKEESPQSAKASRTKKQVAKKSAASSKADDSASSKKTTSKSRVKKQGTKSAKTDLSADGVDVESQAHQADTHEAAPKVSGTSGASDAADASNEVQVSDYAIDVDDSNTDVLNAAYKRMHHIAGIIHHDRNSGFATTNIPEKNAKDGNNLYQFEKGELRSIYRGIYTPDNIEITIYNNDKGSFTKNYPIDALIKSVNNKEDDKSELIRRDLNALISAGREFAEKYKLAYEPKELDLNAKPKNDVQESSNVIDEASDSAKELNLNQSFPSRKNLSESARKELDNCFVKTFEGHHLVCEHQVINGKIEGYQRTFREDGTLKSECCCCGGKIHGVVIFYYPNGIIQNLLTFKHDVLDGPAQTFFEDGKLQSDYHLVDGKIEGKYTTFHANGVIYENMTMKNGLREGHYLKTDANGQKMLECFYVNGLRDNICNFYEAGRLKRASTYKNGVRDGVERIFFPSGEIGIERHFSNDILHGTTLYHLKDSGKIVGEIEYELGRVVSAKVSREELETDRELLNLVYTNGLLPCIKTETMLFPLVDYNFCHRATDYQVKLRQASSFFEANGVLDDLIEKFTTAIFNEAEGEDQ